MILHTVLPGETLYSIAARYGVSTAELIANNAPIDPDRPTVGRSLIILRPRALYTVRAGDTLEQIAQNQGITLRELYR
ncbi:MAG: LysM peptidoglycan-binding domain-containing protein, partial [Clostridia bacterium]|nr:LysM peptidoglycan-binding domain-containing protein [Clostridia bacterium]